MTDLIFAKKTLLTLVTTYVLLTTNATAADLTLLSGHAQVVSLDTTSDVIQFQVSNDAGEPSAGAQLNFNVTGDATLTAQTATTDAAGRAHTRLEATVPGASPSRQA